jgi:hypothetical protein
MEDASSGELSSKGAGDTKVHHHTRAKAKAQWRPKQELMTLESRATIACERELLKGQIWFADRIADREHPAFERKGYEKRGQYAQCKMDLN